MAISCMKIRLQNQLETENVWINPQVVDHLDPVYYSCSPMYYTYYSSPIYAYYTQKSTCSQPSNQNYLYVFYRTNKENGEEGNAKPIKDMSVDELKKEVEEMKKAIWGNPEFDTSELRKENKVYDPKWLLAQMKITRVAELEDFIELKEKNETQVNNRKDDNQAAVNQPIQDNSNNTVNQRVQPVDIPKQNQTVQNLNPSFLEKDQPVQVEQKIDDTASFKEKDDQQTQNLSLRVNEDVQQTQNVSLRVNEDVQQTQNASLRVNEDVQQTQNVSLRVSEDNQVDNVTFRVNNNEDGEEPTEEKEKTEFRMENNEDGQEKTEENPELRVGNNEDEEEIKENQNEIVENEYSTPIQENQQN